MASGPTWNPQRGTWYVQFWNGEWKKKTVTKKKRGWKEGDPPPTKNPPPEAIAEFHRYEAIEKKARSGELADMPDSLETFLMEHLATYRNPRTRETAEVAIKGFLAWCHQNKITDYDQVNRRVCKAWVKHAASTPSPLTGKPLSLATITTHRGYIAAAWGRQVKEGDIPESPWRLAKPDGEDRTKERKSWTPDEFDRILANCEDWLGAILIVGTNTGLRIRALLALEWSHWKHAETDADRFGYIHVPKHLDKIGRGYKVPVSAKLHDFLSNRFGEGDPTLILTGKAGRPILHRNHVGKSIIRACVKAGLPTPQSPNHHMRRTFGRWAIKGQLTGTPVPLYIVSRWLGHADPKTTLRYLDIEEQESAAFMVPDLNRPGDETTMPPSATSRY